MSPTLGEAAADLAGRLADAGIGDARREARLVMAHVLGIEAGTVFSHPERKLSESESLAVATVGERRAAREPLAHITGVREFWSLSFAVTGDTLVPRPDSETLVAAVLESVPDRSAELRLLDFGTGSGCLLLALLSELPAARGLGVDLSPAALAVARRNAQALGLAGRANFVAGDWGSSLAGRFDVIMANPPYIPRGDLAQLEPEVGRWEPRLALDGGPDGLACLRALSPDLARLLAPDGLVAVEIGAGQAGAAILRASGLAIEAIRRDLAGVERCLLARGKIA